MLQPIRLALVNDYEIVVSGLIQMLKPFSDRITVADTEAGGVPDASADIVLFDTFASRRTSLGRIENMAESESLRRLALYTWDAPTQFLEDIKAANVDAVILKSRRGAELVDDLERVMHGEPVGEELLDPALPDDPDLTEREREILALLACGHSNREIADELYLSVDTVKTHLRSLFRKLDVANRTQAALVAARYDLADPARTR